MWRKAMEEEMAAQLANGSWLLVDRTDDMNVIGSRWVYKWKRDHTGAIVRWKARLVVQGFTQVHGLDFFDTYAPVAKMSSVRLVLAIAALLDLELHQLDVDTAFLQAGVKELIYMVQPQGFSVGKHKVCKLLKSVRKP